MRERARARGLALKRTLLPWGPLLASVAIHAGAVGILSGGLSYRSARSRALPPPRAEESKRLLGVSILGSRPRPPRPDRAEPRGPSPADLAPAAERPEISVPAPGGAPEPASGASANALEEYAYRVRGRIGEKLLYPIALRRRGVEGQVQMRLVLDARGGVQTREISASSGSPDLDRLALEAADAAKPFPEPSEELAKTGRLILNLPIEFRLQR